MARFTDEQQRSSESMKSLLALYAVLQGMDQRALDPAVGGHGWYSRQLIDHIAQILHLVIPNFSPCLYFVQYQRFRFGEHGELVTLKTGHLQVLIELMNGLKEDIARRDSAEEPFDNIVFFIEEIITRHHDRGAIVSSLSPRKATRRPPRPRLSIVNPLPANATSDRQAKYHEALSSKLNDVPTIFDSFVLRINNNSAMGASFFLEKGGCISCPGFFRPETSFIQVVKYLLVKYQHLFGSFERIKVCQQCGKLFFEKRLGTKLFCGGTCRKHFNDSLQIPAVRLCRERQNAWITRMYNEILDMPRVFRLQRDDCESCIGQHAGGGCPVLQAKNPNGFQVLQKLGKR